MQTRMMLILLFWVMEELSTPKKMMLGSVACGVTICSSCPVLIIK
jgi:hypothetical protein